MTLTFGGRLESFSVTQARRLSRFLKNGRSRTSSFRPRLNALTLAVAVFSSVKVQYHGHALLTTLLVVGAQRQLAFNSTHLLPIPVLHMGRGTPQTASENLVRVPESPCILSVSRRGHPSTSISPLNPPGA